MALFCFISVRSPGAQWVKRWPTDLAVVSSSSARGEDLFNRKRGSIAHILSLLLDHRPDMTGILLQKDEKSQVIHPSILFLYTLSKQYSLYFDSISLVVALHAF